MIDPDMTDADVRPKFAVGDRVRVKTGDRKGHECTVVSSAADRWWRTKQENYVRFADGEYRFEDDDDLEHAD